MDDSIGVEEDGTLPEPTVASILGIKGPLRFRPHGSAQKAHVVLRQVDISDDSGDEGDNKSMVYFSLFAQKRIEVKPGKEILLAVASPDGRLLETPVILAGDLLGSPTSAEQVTPVTPSKQHIAEPIESTVPPKMRKTWRKRPEVSLPQIPPALPSYTSIGIQAQPSYASKSTETFAEPLARRVSSTAQTVTADKHLTSKPMQTEAVRYVHGAAQTQHVPRGLSPKPELDPTLITPPREGHPMRERSLSPMELDSPSSSPTLSPTVRGTKKSSDSSKSMSFSPPGLSSPISSPTLTIPTVDEVHITPLHLSPDTAGDPPGLSLPPLPELPSIDHSNGEEHGSPKSERTAVSLPNSTTSSTSTVLPSSASPVLGKKPEFAWQTTGPPSIPVSPSLQLPQTPYMPKRKTVPNPFVSGGMLTDFVAASTQQATKAVLSTSAKAGESQPDNALSATTSPVGLVSPSTPLIITDLSVVSPTSSNEDAGQRNAGYLTSNIPSTSKVKVEDIPPRSTQSTPDLLVRQAAGDSRPSTPPEEKPGIITFPPRISHPMVFQANGSHGYNVKRKRTPPPDPKSLVYIPPGSFSNPLGIRPSANPANSQVRKRPAKAAATTRPEAVSPSTRTNKKPVLVGSGWPRIRHSLNGSKPGDSMTQSRIHSPASHATPDTAAVPIRTAITASSVLPLDFNAQAAANFGSAVSRLPDNGDTSSYSVSSSIASSDGDDAVQKRTPMTSESPGSSQASLPSTEPYSRGETVGESDCSQFGAWDATKATTSSSSHVDIFSSMEPGLGDAHGMSTLAPPHTTHPPSRADSSVSDPLHVVGPVHPLPPRPPAFSGGNAASCWSPRRGVKRMGSPNSHDTDLRRKNSFAWPTIGCAHTVRLISNGDVGIRSIVYNSDGSSFAVACQDNSVRIWNNKTRTEVAKLTHNMPVVAVAWMEDEPGVITLGDNGIVSAWTRTAHNKWQWSKILDAVGERRPDDDPVCLAFARDRIAVAFPRTGVKVWLHMKGTWLPQRSILRQNVTTIRFVEDGDALIGGTTDGVLWYCQIPNGTLRAYAFLKSKVHSLDVDVKGTHAIVAQVGGRSHLIGIHQDDHKGKVEQVYATKDVESQAGVSFDFGAVFGSRSQTVLFGALRGCVMVWDRHKAEIIYGFDHAEADDAVMAVASFDGNQSSDSQLVTGTRQGQLTWFVQPATAEGPAAGKRIKIE